MSDNPFLLPPGGAKPPAVEPPIVPDAAPAPGAPSHYIAVPASVESATHRIERPTPEPAPAPAAEPAAEPPAPEPVVEDTRVAAPRGWALTLPDGSSIALDRPLLLGRDPAAIPDRPDAQLLALIDVGKTVSKTHALLEPTDEGVRVRELHSTNGVAVDTAGGRELLQAGGEALAPVGSTILLGSFAIGVTAG
jgi:FHA domain